MRFHFIGLAVHDVDAAAVGLPAGDACGEVLVGVGDALVVLFFVFVLFGVRRRIAALPEGLNKVVALFVVGELLKRSTLFVGDDVDHVLVEPLFVRPLDFFGVVLHLLLFLLGVHGTLKRVHGVRGSLNGFSVLRGICGGVISRFRILARLDRTSRLCRIVLSYGD